MNIGYYADCSLVGRCSGKKLIQPLGTDPRHKTLTGLRSDLSRLQKCMENNGDTRKLVVNQIYRITKVRTSLRFEA